MNIPTDAAYQILIVEDCREHREIYKRYLCQSTSLTCEFSEAETIEDGLKCFTESHPDCVLLDYKLPDGSGLDFLERVASEFPPHEIRVVMLTGHGNEDVIVKAMQKGTMDYLSKSRLSADALCQMVTKAIEKGVLLLGLHERQLEKDGLIVQLQEALAQVKRLSGLLNICANCKKVRDDDGCWQQVEVYIRNRSEAEFSHDMCPECAKRLYPDFYRG